MKKWCNAMHGTNTFSKGDEVVEFEVSATNHSDGVHYHGSVVSLDHIS